MNVYPEISPIKKSLIHLNINTKKLLETVDTLIYESSIKPLPIKQKQIISVTFGLTLVSVEVSPQCY